MQAGSYHSLSLHVHSLVTYYRKVISTELAKEMKIRIPEFSVIAFMERSHSRRNFVQLVKLE